jgi:hypothetical protein
VAVAPGRTATLDRGRLCGIRIEGPEGRTPLVVDLGTARLVPLGPMRDGARRIRLGDDATPRELALIWPGEAPLRTEAMLRRFLERSDSSQGTGYPEIRAWADAHTTPHGLAWIKVQ